MKKRGQKRLSSRSKVSGSLLRRESEWRGTSPNYEQNLSRLLSIAQKLYGQTRGVVECLVQEVTQITQGNAELVMYCREAASQFPQQPSGSISFPVQFCDTTYGMLYVLNDFSQPTRPLIPPTKAYLLAQICGHLLYMLEISVLLQFQYRHLSSQVCDPLTRREQEVLKLLCQGYDQQAIAKTPHIAPTTVLTHRQHIYEKLHVHHSHDLLLVAFRAGLFLPLEGVSGIPPHI